MDLWQSLSGMVEVSITCADPAGIITQLCNAGLTIFDTVDEDAMTVILRIQRRDLKTLGHLCDRKGCSWKLLRRRGLFWRFRLLLSRPVLLFGILLLLILGNFISGRILFVRVEGNINLPQKQILHMAQQCGIHFGAVRREVRSEKMKNALLETMPQLQWAGVNTYGCVAVISVKEREVIRQPEKNSGVSSIIATQDGVIMQMTVLRGSAACKVGQAVKAGQVLISGYTDCGISIRAERADGEIFAVTQRQLQTATLRETHKRTDPGSRTEKYSVIFGKFRINLFKGSGISPAGCVKMYEENYVTLPGGFHLPVCIVKEVWISCEDAPSLLDAQEAQVLLEGFASRYLQQQMIAGTIRGKEEALTEGEDIWLLTGNYDCLEMIGRSRNEEIFTAHG